MYPILVEPAIRNIMKQQLSQCNDSRFSKNTLIFNLVTGAIIVSVISIILYTKYKGKQDIRKTLEKEQKKKEYILSKLHFYQKMKTREFTNIPN